MFSSHKHIAILKFHKSFCFNVANILKLENDIFNMGMACIAQRIGSKAKRILYFLIYDVHFHELRPSCHGPDLQDIKGRRIIVRSQKVH